MLTDNWHIIKYVPELNKSTTGSVHRMVRAKIHFNLEKDTEEVAQKGQDVK